ncbi:MAG: vWA domain-containing protein [Planctomycetota bacterium]|nr:vWA domain-containing protein [Planctomycetota bacterium]
MMPEKITVSNGCEVYRIDPADLDDATRDGFYQPIEHGQTLVGKDNLVFEIPIEDLPSAKQNGLQDLLSAERKAWHRTQAGETPACPGQAPVISPPSSPIANATNPGSLASKILLAELSQAEREEQERREQNEQELEETTGWRWYAVWLRQKFEERRVVFTRHARGTAISALVHVALILILASLILQTNDGPKGLVLSSAPTSDSLIEEVIIEPTPLEISEPTESTEAESPAEAEVVKEETAALPDFAGAISGDAIKPPSRPNASGAGRARPMKRASFFGKRVSAVDYVFVIDNSNSMGGGRFETALNELMIAVSQLTARQRFYVLFYSDTAYPMFHPKPAQKLVQATPKNKELLRYWLETVQLCLKTNGKEAITAAFALQPDVIFVLGDGAFTDGASNYFAARPQKKIPLHTLGMEVKPKDAILFEKLAKAHGGTYKDVGVAAGAKEMSKKIPRPRNSAKGPVWGLTLKPKPNLK